MRLQILELPQAAGDDGPPPFLLIVDECDPEVSLDALDSIPAKAHARGVLVFADTVTIPANDTTAYAPPAPTEPWTMHVHVNPPADLPRMFLNDTIRGRSSG